ncbi:MAG: serine kinase [Nioella sp.]|uniref:HPr kinase/phosphorylase n=1 Tax=Nioella halotolerans TaxID=2303578 RepID=UPI0026A8BDDA
MTRPADPCLRDHGEAAPDGRFFCRATGVAMDGLGVLILGPAGSGKSRLALDLMGLGGRLVCDDGVLLSDDGRISRPDAAPPLIEARGVGLLRADPVAEAPLALTVDLSRPEAERLPPRRMAATPGGPVPLILGAGHPFLAQAIRQYTRHGREA